MATKIVVLVILVISTPSLQNISDNQIEDDDPLKQIKAEILKGQTLESVSGLVNNFMNSDGAKQIGDILSNAAAGDSAGDVLQGLGAMLGGQSKGGIDPAMIGTVMNMFTEPSSKDSGFDMGIAMSLLDSFMGQGGQHTNIWTYIPMILSTINSFVGPEAQQREKNHQGHADMMPPLLEKIHVLFDHFLNSEMGKHLINTLGAEKFVKVFADENGRMSYRRFVDMLENHSFRKHWIRMITNKIANILSHFSDPKIQKKYLTTFQHFINSIIKSQGYPKTTLFDPNRPTETITALINHVAKDQLKMKVSSKQYVKPFVEYIQEVFRLANKRGMLNVNSDELANKLADTINLEVIEPVVRVNRAFRFARKVPQCDKYVMCLVNRQPEEDKPSLPGLASLLSKSSSLIYSWFLSSVTGTSYFTLYQAITDTTNSCQEFYVDACHDFHLEEQRVRRELVHSEL